MTKNYPPAFVCLASALWIGAAAAGQTPIPDPAALPQTAELKAARAAYLLGPNDKIVIRTNDMDEVKHELRISQDGFITLPQIGQVRAKGLTAEQLQREIANRLEKYVRRPDVAVDVAEFHSQPVSVVGAVKTPGIHQVEGHKTLMEVLALAGGLADNAGFRVKITRRAEWGVIPLANARVDPASQCSVAEAELSVLMDASDPQQNIEVRPDDVISVPRAALVYVVGEVKKPGGFVLAEKRNISVLQALALAEGLGTNAATRNVRILRTVPHEQARTEIRVDVKSIYAGKSDDVPLQSDDILFIPASQTRKALVRAAESAIQIGSGVLIYSAARQ